MGCFHSAPGPPPPVDESGAADEIDAMLDFDGGGEESIFIPIADDARICILRARVLLADVSRIAVRKAVNEDEAGHTTTGRTVTLRTASSSGSGGIKKAAEAFAKANADAAVGAPRFVDYTGSELPKQLIDLVDDPSPPVVSELLSVVLKELPWELVNMSTSMSALPGGSSDHTTQLMYRDEVYVLGKTEKEPPGYRL
mmetsp:Transcript_2010/g.4680  ORF Transcript_2010/g.4680 Transcript_2010/m.4680 type:complete len:198 (-) Transcript_2010:186-779(-)|eukprot:g1317.t1